MRRTKVESHFDGVAGGYDIGKKKYSYYYENLKNLLSSIIPKNKKVLEIGCGTGELLASLKPSHGYGMDISSKMVKIAKLKYKSNRHLYFSSTFPSLKSLSFNRYSFDYIFMSDVIEHLEKPEETFKKISKLMGKKTIFINTMANPIWEPLLMFWEKMGWKMPEGPHNRIKSENLINIMEKCGLKIVKHDYKLLVPIKIPLISKFANKYLEKYFKKYAFIEYFIVRNEA